MSTIRIRTRQDDHSQEHTRDHPRDISARRIRAADRPVRLPVMIHSVDSHWGTVYSVNERRAFVAVDQTLPVDSLVEVEFFLPHHSQCLRVIGEVRWVGCYNAGSGCGTPGMMVEFWEMGQEGREHFDQLVRSC